MKSEDSFNKVQPTLNNLTKGRNNDDRTRTRARGASDTEQEKNKKDDK